MLRPRSDFPLDADPAGRFLPWLIAFMVFLAVLGLGGALTIERVIGGWQSSVTQTITVQIPPADDVIVDKRRIDSVLDALRQTDDVVHAELVPRTKVLDLLEPWLGGVDSGADLPLPHLIDVAVSHAGAIPVSALYDRLILLAPGTTVDDHGVWVARLVKLARALEAIAWITLLLIAAITVATVVFATRAGLAVHHGTIEVLHLIGARDNYIARQFGHHAMLLGLKGGLIGGIMGAVVLTLVGYLSHQLDAALLPSISLDWPDWLMIATTPLLAAVVARLTARFTVVRTLKKML